VNSRIFRSAVLLTFLALIVSPLHLSSQSRGVDELSSVRIFNFGKVNETYYRGAQPSPREYPQLAALGVRTVIDLRDFDGKVEESLVRRAGMNFYQIPLTTTRPPSEAAIAQFLKLVNDPANQPIYVHCQNGRHRTGVMTAIYRMTHDDWDADHAYEEMQRYKFDAFPTHPVLKRFVYHYYAGLSARRASNQTSQGSIPQLHRSPVDRETELQKIHKTADGGQYLG